MGASEVVLSVSRTADDRAPHDLNGQRLDGACSGEGE